MLLIFDRHIISLQIRREFIILTAAGRVGSNINNTGRICDFTDWLSVFICGFLHHRFQAIHHVASGIYMVMSHEHCIDTKLFKYRCQCASPGKNIVIYRMAGCTVNRMMEYNEFPVCARI